jgi:hypothetical protein
MILAIRDTLISGMLAPKNRRRILIGLAASCFISLSAAGYLVYLSFQITRQVPLYLPSQVFLATQTSSQGLLSPVDTLPAKVFTKPTLPISPEGTLPLISSPTSTVTNVAGSDCVITETGGLITEMQGILQDMPGPGTNKMVVPDDAQMAAWKIILQVMLEGDTRTACAQILENRFPYHILDFTDIPFNREAYLVLKEDEPVTVGWGTYVLRTKDVQVEVVVEVPHPIADDRTALEGVEIFRQIHGRALLVAGTHRCANQDYSPCTGKTMACGSLEPFRSSDVAHASQTMFQAAHEALVGCGGSRLALQLHGNDLAACPDLFVSNGTLIPHKLSAQIFEQAVRSCSPFSVDLAQGKESECAFYNGASVQAVYSNGCARSPGLNACTDYVGQPSNPEQFISLEQSSRFRQDYGCLLDALKEVWPGQ